MCLFWKKNEYFQPGIVTSFGQVVAAKSIVAVKPLAPTPPRIPEAKQQGPRPGMLLCHAIAIAKESKSFSSVTVEEDVY